MKNISTMTAKMVFPTIITLGIFTSCSLNSKEEYYLDFDEIVQNSNIETLEDMNGSFDVFNDNDTIYLAKDRHTKPTTLKMGELKRLQLTPVDSIIKWQSKITIDSLAKGNKIKLPNLFLIKRDTLDGTVTKIKVGQAFAISKHNYNYEI